MKARTFLKSCLILAVSFGVLFPIFGLSADKERVKNGVKRRVLGQVAPKPFGLGWIQARFPRLPRVSLRVSTMKFSRPFAKQIATCVASFNFGTLANATPTREWEPPWKREESRAADQLDRNPGSHCRRLRICRTVPSLACPPTNM